MSATRSRLEGMSPLIAAGSAVHQHSVTGDCVLYLSPYTVLGLYLAFSLMSNFPSNPILSYPSLTFSQSMDYTAPHSTVQVCLTGICISQLWSYITWLLTYHGYLGVYGQSTYQEPSSSLPSVRFPTSGNTEPIKWSWIHTYRCHLME